MAMAPGSYDINVNYSANDGSSGVVVVTLIVAPNNSRTPAELKTIAEQQAHRTISRDLRGKGYRLTTTTLS